MSSKIFISWKYSRGLWTRNVLGAAELAWTWPGQKLGEWPAMTRRRRWCFESAVVATVSDSFVVYSLLTRHLMVWWLFNALPLKSQRPLCVFVVCNHNLTTPTKNLCKLFRQRWAIVLSYLQSWQQKEVDEEWMMIPTSGRRQRVGCNCKLQWLCGRWRWFTWAAAFLLHVANHADIQLDSTLNLHHCWMGGGGGGGQEWTEQYRMSLLWQSACRGGRRREGGKKTLLSLEGE